MLGRCVPFLRFVDHLAGWLLLTCGMAMLGAAVLAPAWHGAWKLAAQRDLLRAQVQHLGEQEQSYRRFHQALSQNDPVLLQRLAYQYLRLKPVATTLLRLPSEPNPLRSARVGGGGHRHGDESGPAQVDLGVGAWLHKPMPAAAVVLPFHRASRLATIMEGPARLTLLVSGVVCLLMGLLLPVGKW